MKKTKKQKNDYLALLLLLVIGYVTYGLNASYVRAMEINSSIKRQEALQQQISEMSVEELIDYIAPQYGANKTELKVITYCEAHHNLGYVIHDGGLGKGTTGYQKATFELDKIRFNRPDLNYESNFDQITMMAISFNAGEVYKKRWTTYVAYKNGGTYTFIDRYGKKHTAHCDPSLALRFQ